MVDPLDDLDAAIAKARAKLIDHRVYDAVADLHALRTFMRAHVFAVWDFMSLLKALQRTVTCVTVPWTPPASRLAARLINEIVLGEETDDVVGMSHYELYLDAMREIDADTSSIETVVALTGSSVHTPVGQAMVAAKVPSYVRTFVECTMNLASSTPEAVAAAFLLGREDLVPAMFRRLLPTVEKTHRASSLQLYLKRHIDVDEGQHGPMGRRLLVELCGTDDTRWRNATDAALASLTARAALWDGVVAELEPLPPPAPTLVARVMDVLSRR